MLTTGIDEANCDLADTIARVAGGRQPLAIGKNSRWRKRRMRAFGIEVLLI